jgi:hypothetical protein
MFDNVRLEDFYAYFELASLIFAVFYYSKYKGYGFYKYFLYYLLSIVVFSFISRPEINRDWIEIFNNGVKVLNVFTFFEFNLIVLIYYHLIKNKNTLKLIKIIAIIFNIIYFISFFLLELQNYTVILEGIFNSFFIILFFKELLNSDSVLNYKKLLPFWISVGMLLFYLTSIPFFTVLYVRVLSNRIMFPILFSLIILLHSCFIFGLVSCKKMKN